MKLIKLLLTLTITISCGNLYASSTALEGWDTFSRTGNAVILKGWLRNAAKSLLSRSDVKSLNLKAPAFYGELGLFITFVKDGKVRGCFGAFSHRSSSLETCLKRYIKGALFSDPRYAQLEPWELDESEIILTIADRPLEVTDINDIDIWKNGVLIESENQQSTVIVPAEYRTGSAIRSMTEKTGHCRIYRFRAVTIK